MIIRTLPHNQHFICTGRCFQHMGSSGTNAKARNFSTNFPKSIYLERNWHTYQTSRKPCKLLSLSSLPSLLTVAIVSYGHSATRYILYLQLHDDTVVVLQTHNHLTIPANYVCMGQVHRIPSPTVRSPASWREAAMIFACREMTHLNGTNCNHGTNSLAKNSNILNQ